ncbi:MAG: nucleotidyltransferase family protein [Sedimentisphaerales bacterium]|nr:nucleotidyltransferase family protein [Sedimentisphaerales bacterium]
MEKAVILARGLGTRMRRDDDAARLSGEQAAAAEGGVKAMIPIDRPFLDYVMHNLAEAGYKHICLVIGPEHDQILNYYAHELKPTRIRIEFAIQIEPLGTADAVAASQVFAGNDPFLVINSDTYYPLEALIALRKINGSGLAAFARDSMFTGSNIPPERLSKFAVIQTNEQGYMVRIIEKPDAQTIKQLPEPVCTSMNCWRFGPSIFKACRAISPSPRGELELPDAVQYCIDELIEPFRAVTINAPVLDLSSRSDIAGVVQKLSGTPVNL